MAGPPRDQGHRQAGLRAGSLTGVVGRTLMNYVERAASPRRRGLVARLLFGAALPAIAIAFAMPAHAAEDGASADSADAAATDADKDIILVVGERLETNLMKIPMAIQDIPAERLQDLKINSV